MQATPPPTELKRHAHTVVSSERMPHRSTWDDLWNLYSAAFEPLRERALLNHLYPRADFEALLSDDRVTKLIARSGSRPVGLAMVTSVLELVPQISPPFLHARFPEESARNAVFFGIMVFVADSHRRSTAFARLVAGMGQVTADESGVIVFDICRHNMAAIELDRQIESISRWFPGSSFEQVDEQRYFAASLPTQPARRLPISRAGEHAAHVTSRRPNDLTEVPLVVAQRGA